VTLKNTTRYARLWRAGQKPNPLGSVHFRAASLLSCPWCCTLPHGLPATAVLWSASVAGSPIRPGCAPDGSLLLPLEKNRSGDEAPVFVVEVSYVDRTPAWVDKGRLRLSLLTVDLPISKSHLLVHHPPLFHLTAAAGVPGPFRILLMRRHPPERLRPWPKNRRPRRSWTPKLKRRSSWSTRCKIRSAVQARPQSAAASCFSAFRTFDFSQVRIDQREPNAGCRA
jgi:hypothetical protein